MSKLMAVSVVSVSICQMLISVDERLALQKKQLESDKERMAEMKHIGNRRALHRYQDAVYDGEALVISLQVERAVYVDAQD